MESRQPQRDFALILLMIDTGMRLSEVASLNLADVDLIEGRCRVIGKGSRERLVPIGRRTRKALRAWTSVRRPSPAANSPLFVAPRGSRLSARGIHQLVRRLARRAGIETRCSPHVLRLTFARAFLTNGGDVFSLQRILGHSPGDESASKMVQTFFNEAKDAISTPTPSPAVPDGFVDGDMTEAERDAHASRLAKASRKADDAIAAEEAGDESAAQEIWYGLFGDPFPKPDKDDRKAKIADAINAGTAGIGGGTIIGGAGRQVVPGRSFGGDPS